MATIWGFRRLVRANRAMLIRQKYPCCPLGAALIGSERRPCSDDASRILGIEEEYCCGVANGFDDEFKPHTPDEHRGYRYGKRMRLIVKHLRERSHMENALR